MRASLALIDAALVTRVLIILVAWIHLPIATVNADSATAS
jgi:hypothetical protein